MSITRDTKMKYFIIGLLTYLLTITNAFSKDITIDMLNKRDDGQKMVYSLDVIKVNVGDTVTWLPKTKGHNVQFIKAPDGIKKLSKSKLNKKYTYKFEKSGMYLYQCTPHKSMGMIGLVIVDDDLSNKKDIAKAKVFGKSKKKLKKL